LGNLLTFKVRSSQYNKILEKASSGVNSSNGMLIKSKSLLKEDDPQSNDNEGESNNSSLNLFEGLMADYKHQMLVYWLIRGAVLHEINILCLCCPLEKMNQLNLILLGMLLLKNRLELV
jgi:hypothetical protein